MRQIFILPQLTQPIQPNISRFSRYVLFLRRYAKNGTRHSTANWQPRYCPQNLCVCDGAYKSRLDIVKGMASWAALSAPATLRLPRSPTLSRRLTPPLPTGAKSSPSTARNFPRPKRCFRAFETNFHTAVRARATRITSRVRAKRLSRSPSLYGAPKPKRPRRKALPLPRVKFTTKNEKRRTKNYIHQRALPPT